MIEQWRMLSILGFFALVGCGGDNASSNGGNTGSNNPPPVATSTPAPTPTPTPTPTSQSPVTNLLNLSSAKQFDSLVSTLAYDRLASGAIVLPDIPMLSSPENNLAFSDNPMAKSLGYFYATSRTTPNSNYPNYFSITFLSSSRVSTLSNSAYDIYRVGADSPVYTLTRLTPGPSNSRLALYYSGIGVAEATNTNASSGTTVTDYRAFGYGLPTELSGVPSSGTTKYEGIVIGRAISLSGSTVYDVTGTMAITLDFANENYAGTVNLTGTDDRSGQSVSLGSFPISRATKYPVNVIYAYIGENKSSLQAKLAGPMAEELEGSFNLSIPDPRMSGSTLNIIGAVAARR